MHTIIHASILKNRKTSEPKVLDDGLSQSVCDVLYKFQCYHLRFFSQSATGLHVTCLLLNRILRQRMGQRPMSSTSHSIMDLRSQLQTQNGIATSIRKKGFALNSLTYLRYRCYLLDLKFCFPFSLISTENTTLFLESRRLAMDAGVYFKNGFFTICVYVASSKFARFNIYSNRIFAVLSFMKK